MDVALRAVNWINGVMLFRHRIVDDPDERFFDEMEEGLWLAGLHVWKNLEWDGPQSKLSGNHFLSNLTGLLGLGLFFSDQRLGRRWFAFAKRCFEQEMQIQVNPDGTNYETSTSYHRLVMEMFLWARSICRTAGNPFSEAYEARLCCMADFVKACTSPSGKICQIGDNDSGRVLSCGIADPNDHAYLYSGDVGGAGGIDRWILCGNDVPDASGCSGDGSFTDGGFWFARRSDAWFGVRAGVLSHNGGHAHCDQLSFVLAVGSHDFIIDPGTGVYSADPGKRNRYRSAGAHNACRINDWEPNRFKDGKKGLFGLADDTATAVLEWESDNEGSSFIGKHRGYERFREGLHYERSMVLTKGSLEITDTFSCLEESDRLEWCFTFAPKVVLRRDKGMVLATLDRRIIRIIPEAGADLSIGDTTCSPAYGVEVPTVKLILRLGILRTGVGRHVTRFEWENL